MKFRIEYIFDRQGPVYLRECSARAVFLFQKTPAWGVSIKRSLSQLRAIAPDGAPDLAGFTFVLATANDLPKLSIGQEVELN